jgi:hypothetical protein
MPALPDLSGCLRALLLLLIALVIVMMLGGLLMLLGSGIGALAGLGGHAGSGGNTAQGGGHGTGKGQGGQDQGGKNDGEQPDAQGIHVREAKVVEAIHSASHLRGPRVLVSWDNFTNASVHKIWAKVTSIDSRGQVIATAENVVIYDGEPVTAAGSHDDLDGEKEGFDPPGTMPPTEVKVVVTKYE